jgi:7-carboxy-7-deazaguanine synthase
VYCDTAYAFHDGRWMAIPDILAAVGKYPARLVEVTGGEPLAQPHAITLLGALVAAEYEVLLETSGAISIAGVPEGVHRIVDLKTPDSGECARNDWTNLDHLRAGDEIKFVVGSRRDYEWARDVAREHRLWERVPVLVSPVWESTVATDLAAWLLADGWPGRYQMQLHKWLWPGVERGI